MTYEKLSEKKVAVSIFNRVVLAAKAEIWFIYTFIFKRHLCRYKYSCVEQTVLYFYVAFKFEFTQKFKKQTVFKKSNKRQINQKDDDLWYNETVK